MEEQQQPVPDPNVQPRRRWLGRGGRLFAFGLLIGLLSLSAWGLVRANSGPVESGPAPDRKSVV
jgi:hypothetical protein